MLNSNRPLSPFLQIYRLPMVAWISITHRVMGIGLVIGLFLLAAWLAAAAIGPEAFAVVQGLMGTILGKLVLFGFTVAMFYHLVNGVRHLFWDIGWGWQLRQAKLTAWIMLAITGALSVLSWIAVLL